MPGRDGTGPMGFGRQNGRGMGFCGDDASSDRSNEALGEAPGRSFGMGFGRGRGFGGGRGTGRRMRRGGFFQAPVREEDRGFLEERKQALQSALSAIDQRLGELGDPDSRES